MGFLCVMAGLGGPAPAADLGLRVRIPAVLRLEVIEASEGIAVFDVLANVRAYDLRFEIADADVASVEIHGLGAPLVVGREGGLYRVLNQSADGRGPVRYALSYRTVYSRAAAPGPRPVPLRISAHVP